MQNINILTLGNPDGVGAFFPKGLNGRITKPTGLDKTVQGLDDFPTGGAAVAQVAGGQVVSISPLVATQVGLLDVGRQHSAGGLKPAAVILAHMPASSAACTSFAATPVDCSWWEGWAF